MKNPFKTIFKWRDNFFLGVDGFSKWEKTRVQGKWNFIFQIAAIWTVLMALVFPLLTTLTFNGFDELDKLPFKFVVLTILHFSGGIIMGLLSWRQNEKDYRKNKADAAIENTSPEIFD